MAVERKAIFFWFGCSILYLVILFVLVPLLSQKLKYSKFQFEHVILLERQTDQLKSEESLASEDLNRLWERHKANKTYFLSNCSKYHSNGGISVAIITKNREAYFNGQMVRARYLTRIVNALYTATETLLEAVGNEPALCNLNVAVCNVNSESNDEVEMMKNFIPVHNLTRGRSHPSTFVQESMDYKACLEYALEAAAKDVNYFLVLEDDAMPHQDMLYVLHKLLQNTTASSNLPRPHWSLGTDFFYMKVYHPNRLACYLCNPVVYRIAQWIALGAVFGTFATLMCRCLCPRGMDMSTRMSVTIFILFALFAMTSVEMIGRIYFEQLRRFHWQLYTIAPAPGCCSPAMVFTRQSISVVASTFSPSNSQPLDFIMFNYALSHHKAIWLLEPNLVSHIGTISSVRHRVLDPNIV